MTGHPFSSDEVRDEQRRMMRLRLRVDLTAYRLRHTDITREEALTLIEETREEVLSLFPEKEDVFELILRPRFRRILNDRMIDRWGLADSRN